MLSLRWLLNYALLLAIAGLAAFAFFSGGSDEAARESGISRLEPDDVKRIQLSAGESALVIESENGGWRIASPVDWPADATSVERLLGILKLKADALDTASADLSALGLEPPLAEWRLDDTRLLFGTTNNIGERRYVMIESRLYLLPDVHLAFAAQGLAGFSARSLLPQQGDLVALSLPGLDIRRDADNVLSSSPERSSEQLQRLVDGWHRQAATGIRAFTAANGGEAVEARFANGRSLQFRLLASDGEIVIANPAIGLQYHFGADLHDRLLGSGGPDDAMPELPEVETTRRGIAPHVDGQRIERVILRETRLRWPISPEIEDLEGRRIGSVSRRAKYLLMPLEQGHLIWHLGMSGSMRVLPAGSPAALHEHVELQLENGQALKFRDPRRFGALLYSDGDPLQHRLLQGLGPEPLSADFNADYLHAVCPQALEFDQDPDHEQSHRRRRRQHLRLRGPFPRGHSAHARGGTHRQAAHRPPRRRHPRNPRRGDRARRHHAAGFHPGRRQTRLFSPRAASLRQQGRLPGLRRSHPPAGAGAARDLLLH